jgi:hydrogenase maturation protease
MKNLLIAIGEEFRGDDAVGPLVVRAAANRLPGGWTATEHRGDLTGLLDAWEGAAHVIVVDAVASGAPAGTLHRLDGLAQALPPDFAAASSHGVGLGGAVALGRALGRLPARLSVVGIEGVAAPMGGGLSREVEAALPVAVELVLAVARRA